MKQKKLSVLTLLASLMLLIFSGSALASTVVTFENKTLVHDCVDTLLVKVSADDAIKCFDFVAELAEVDAFATIDAVNLYVNGSDNGVDITQVDGAPADLFRFWGCDIAGFDDVIFAGGDQLLAEIIVTVGFDLGTFTIDGASWEVYPDVFDAEPGFVDSDCEFTSLTVNAGTYTVINNPPVFTNCIPLHETECGVGTYVYYFEAVDDDCASTLTFLPGNTFAGALDANSGRWEITVSEMCGLNSYQVIVEDEHGAQTACDFDLYVGTEQPLFTECNDSIPMTIIWGDMASGQFMAEDPDNCPGDLVYEVSSFDGPGMIVLDEVTGEWSWQTEEGNPDYIAPLLPDDSPGYWTLCVKVDDGCAEALYQEPVECCIMIRVVGMDVWVEKVGDDPDDLVYQGHYVEVPVNAFLGGVVSGGFDLLLSYDPSALTFNSAAMGTDLADCGWEYFTYRYGNVGNCDGPCPSGLLRIVAMAEQNDGGNHPDCFITSVDEMVNLANLTFYVTNDRTYECQYVPIKFYWFDCGDNGISDANGDTLWIADEVFYLNPGEPPVNITGDDFVGGWQFLLAELGIDCLEDPDGSGPKVGPIPWIDFLTGGVDIACAEEIDARGDINLNNVANEIADAVVFTNYFINGLGAFTIRPEGQIAATDVNNDGKVLTVGDLVYLIRVITGDALPFPKLTPWAENGEVVFNQTGTKTAVTTSSNVDIGAAHFVFEVNGTAGEVTALIDGMDVRSNMADGELRVLVYDIGEGRIPAGANDLFSVEVDGEITLVESNMSDYYGNLMTTTVTSKILPDNFALRQNFPNPFNPTTEIIIDVPGQSEWKLDIYNVTGQLVESFDGYTAGGQVKVTWNADRVASGIYFYKATVGQYTDVKKMVLMK